MSWLSVKSLPGTACVSREGREHRSPRSSPARRRSSGSTMGAQRCVSSMCKAVKKKNLKVTRRKANRKTDQSSQLHWKASPEGGRLIFATCYSLPGRRGGDAREAPRQCTGRQSPRRGTNWCAAPRKRAPRRESCPRSRCTPTAVHRVP